MEPIAKSGLYYPNKIARLAMTALGDVMGKNGLNAILNLASLSIYIDNLPPDNLERAFDFADFSAMHGALEVMYGQRGGRGLAQRAGRAVFMEGLRNFGALAGAGDLAFKILPLSTKLHIGIPAMAKIFSTTSDQLSTVVEKEDHFLYSIHRCPCCYGRHSDKVACYMATGLLQEGLKWVSGGREFRVVETACIAMDEPTCDFIIYKEPIS
jgi:predicted hydrocarbon binding protein